jgi:glycosyltransferase involved in cell wall biosynthesis
LYVSALAERGGVEVVLLNIVKALDRSQFTPVVALLEQGPFADEVRETGTETWVIGSGGVRNVPRAVGAVARLVRLIKEAGVDIVHTMNAKAHLYGAPAAMLCGVPCLYHLHGVPRASLSRDGLVSVLSVVAPAARTIACSEYVAEGFRRAWGNRRRVTVVHNGLLPFPRLRPSPGVREEFGISDSALLVLMVARLQRWKGVHVFLDAVAELAKHRPDSRFLVLGGTLFGLDKEYASELRVRSERLGIARALQFAGHRSDTWRFYDAADVVVHASINPDPFPTVLLEAMAAGKPVIASDLGGPREIVLHGETGLLVPAGRADLLAESVLTLAQDPSLRARMGQSGAARFQANFLARRMADDLQAIYTQLLSPASSNARLP